MTVEKPNVFPKIEEVIKELKPDSISAERKINLQLLAEYIQVKLENEENCRLHFICTHNSRRSHLAQVWAQTFAFYFKLKNVWCYSGGTESTVLFPMIAETLSKAGFEIENNRKENNPIYRIKYAENEPSIKGFSKKINDNSNPKSEFIAIMTCDSANEACPVVSGAEKRISLTFEDPKVFDNTPQQAEKYTERSLQIATELFYVFSQIKP